MSNVNIPINCDKISYNTDIDPHIAKETTDFMLNCYVEEAGNYGVLTNMKGNRRIPITLPEGVNEFIKTTIDTDSRSLILFLYNSNNNHCIFRVNADNYKVERVIWSNPILNFSLDYPVVKADCVGDYVFWVDGHTENKHLHVEKAINFTNAPTYNCRIKGTNFRTDTLNKLSVDDVVYINIDNSGYTGYHKVETIIDDYTFSVYGQTAITGPYRDWETDRKSTRLNSSHSAKSRMPSSA